MDHDTHNQRPSGAVVSIWSGLSSSLHQNRPQPLIVAIRVRIAGRGQSVGKVSFSGTVP